MVVAANSTSCEEAARWCCVWNEDKLTLDDTFCTTTVPEIHVFFRFGIYDCNIANAQTTVNAIEIVESSLRAADPTLIGEDDGIACSFFTCTDDIASIRILLGDQSVASIWHDPRGRDAALTDFTETVRMNTTHLEIRQGQSMIPLCDALSCPGTEAVSIIEECSVTSGSCEPDPPVKDPGNLLLVRPFSGIHDVHALIDSFDAWTDLHPCRTDMAGLAVSRVDIMLYYSGNITSEKFTESGLQSTIDTFLTTYENKSWAQCFGEVWLEGANVPAELDIYNPTNQAYDNLWNSGPNEQFKALMRTYIDGNDAGARKVDIIYIMEPDSVPQYEFWLEFVINEMNQVAPWTIFGSRYVGHNWDMFLDQLPVALRIHINGNGLYNLTSDLFKSVFDILGSEQVQPKPSPGISSFDVRIPEILLEDFEIPEDDLDFLSGYKLSSRIANFAATYRVSPFDMQGQPAAVVHGARDRYNWMALKPSQLLDLVITDWGIGNGTGDTVILDSSSLFAGDIDGVLSSLRSEASMGRLPFTSITIVTPSVTVGKTVDEAKDTILPGLKVFIRNRTNDDDIAGQWDMCDALPTITSDWFMLSNAHHIPATPLKLPVSSGPRPVIPFIFKSSVYCTAPCVARIDAANAFQHRRKLARSRRGLQTLNGNETGGIDDNSIGEYGIDAFEMNVILNKSIVADYCEALQEEAPSTAPTVNGYLAYMMMMIGNNAVNQAYEFANMERYGLLRAFHPRTRTPERRSRHTQDAEEQEPTTERNLIVDSSVNKLRIIDDEDDEKSAHELTNVSDDFMSTVLLPTAREPFLGRARRVDCEEVCTTTTPMSPTSFECLTTTTTVGVQRERRAIPTTPSMRVPFQLNLTYDGAEVFDMSETGRCAVKSDLQNAYGPIILRMTDETGTYGPIPDCFTGRGVQRRESVYGVSTLLNPATIRAIRQLNSKDVAEFSEMLSPGAEVDLQRLWMGIQEDNGATDEPPLPMRNRRENNESECVCPEPVPYDLCSTSMATTTTTQAQRRMIRRQELMKTVTSSQCVDDEMWTITIVKKGSQSVKTCNWVSRRPNSYRCQQTSSEGVAAWKACECAGCDELKPFHNRYPRYTRSYHAAAHQKHGARVQQEHSMVTPNLGVGMIPWLEGSSGAHHSRRSLDNVDVCSAINIECGPDPSHAELTYLDACPPGVECLVACFGEGYKTSFSVALCTVDENLNAAYEYPQGLPDCKPEPCPSVGYATEPPCLGGAPIDECPTVGYTNCGWLEMEESWNSAKPVICEIDPFPNVTNLAFMKPGQDFPAIYQQAVAYQCFPGYCTASGAEPAAVKCAADGELIWVGELCDVNCISIESNHIVGSTVVDDGGVINTLQQSESRRRRTYPEVNVSTILEDYPMLDLNITVVELYSEEVIRAVLQEMTVTLNSTYGITDLEGNSVFVHMVSVQACRVCFITDPAKLLESCPFCINGLGALPINGNLPTEALDSVVIKWSLPLSWDFDPLAFIPSGNHNESSSTLDYTITLVERALAFNPGDTGGMSSTFVDAIDFIFTSGSDGCISFNTFVSFARCDVTLTLVNETCDFYCDIGYYGETTSVLCKTFADGSTTFDPRDLPICALKSCPATHQGYEPDNQSPYCKCLDGFVGCGWDYEKTDWKLPEPQPCPSSSDTPGNCSNCPDGRVGSISWDSEQAKWDLSQCNETLACPAEIDWPPVCSRCPVGSTGEVFWNVSSMSWDISRCEMIACPNTLEESPACTLCYVAEDNATVAWRYSENGWWTEGCIDLPFSPKKSVKTKKAAKSVKSVKKSQKPSKKSPKVKQGAKVPKSIKQNMAKKAKKATKAKKAKKTTLSFGTLTNSIRTDGEGSGASHKLRTWRIVGVVVMATTVVSVGIMTAHLLRRRRVIELTWDDQDLQLMSPGVNLTWDDDDLKSTASQDPV